jgi:restriction system protein
MIEKDIKNLIAKYPSELLQYPQLYPDLCVEHALKTTDEINKDIYNINNILKNSLELPESEIWDSLKDKRPLPEGSPKKTKIKEPKKPHPEDIKFKVDLTAWDHLNVFSRAKKELAASEKFQKEIEKYKTKYKKYQKKQEEYYVLLQKWEKRRDKLGKELTKVKKGYHQKNDEDVVKYYELLLMMSEYPKAFPRGVELEFNAENGVLIIDYRLPSLEDLPKLKEVKYVKSAQEFREISLTTKEKQKIYDSCLYQITLRTMYELYKHDYLKLVTSIVFNGWVNSRDASTGHKITPCILSIQSDRSEFMDLNLKLVDPRECFKKLKGVASSKLHALAPVPPILSLNKNDKRFIDSRVVAGQIPEGENIAAMPWDDFEHLIRELFEKEFAQSGGEVKVTQASRDGGVDAIAFDPDPIRGGKIIIQAKRYTNTVGVDAVRDLYGTVINEGAMKGILVTTAEYGPDSYNFAKDKPLTLLTGGNLLHMLKKHGHRAKIDLSEAKEILKEEKNKHS